MNKENLKLGQIIKVIWKDDRKECVGFVSKITNKRFYIDLVNRGVTIFYPKHWFYYDEVDIEILRGVKQ